jgi:ZIP family zinc transporter
MIIDWYKSLGPVMQVFLATGFTWLLTAMGAGVVFFFKGINRKFLDAMLGFAAGVMIAASFFSLLGPSIEMSKGMEVPIWFPAAIGFMLGGSFLRLFDKILPHLHIGFPMEEAEGVKTSWKRSALLIMAITLHNIPEGLAVGVAFGAAAVNSDPMLFASAIALTIGLGLQNLPEGMAVSVPLRREGFSRKKSFFFGQLSGATEPIAGIIGAALVITIQPILPYAMSFAAGAMIYVVIEELIPESQLNKNTDLATLGAMLGFTVMMILDVGLGG